MRERALEIFSNPTWYSKPCVDPVQEQIGRSLLLATVDSNMHHSMLRQPNCQEMFNYLNSRFFTVTRAEQLMCWDRLINLKLSDFSSSAEAVMKLYETLDDFISFGLDINRETIGGLALQSSIEAGSELRREVDRRVEQDLGGSSKTLSKKAVTPDQILKHIDIVKRQLDLGSSRTNTFSASVPQAHRSAIDTHSDQAKEYYDPQTWNDQPKQVEGLASSGPQCWNCRSTDHLLSKCRLPRRADFDRPPSSFNSLRRQTQQPGGNRSTNAPMIAPGNFQAWYPIVTPPGYQHCGYQPTQSPYAPPTTGPGGHQPGKRADWYRPDYRPKPPSQQPKLNPQASVNSADITGPPSHPAQEPSNPTQEYYRPLSPIQESTSRMIEIGVFDEGLQDDVVPSFRHLTVGNDDDPVLDTGATHHLTSNRYALLNFRLLEKPIPLRVATKGGGSFITGAGDLSFPTRNGQIAILRGVLYCEQASSTLISMAALRKANSKFLYNHVEDAFHIFSPHWLLLFRCHFCRTTNKWCLPQPLPPNPSGEIPSSIFLSANLRPPVSPYDQSSSPPLPTLSNSSSHYVPATHNLVEPTKCNENTNHVESKNLTRPTGLAVKTTEKELFESPLEVSPSFTWRPEDLTKDEATLLLWHRIFGHASLRVIRRLVKQQAAFGLPEKMPAGQLRCPVCAIHKSNRNNVLHRYNRSVKPLEILNVDLMGPFPIETYHKGRYVLTLKDLGSGYNEVKIMTNKSEANKHIVDTINRLERQTELKVKVLRSDNGGEFANKALATFLTSKGIRAERSLPYHHYQNGVVERFNRTVSDMGRTVLGDSRLPQRFWGFAFEWASWTLNQLPNKTSGDKTPYEALFKVKPQVDKARIFGSIAYVLQPPEKRNKLADHAFKAHVISHLDDSKGWMFWVPETDKLVTSAWATFEDVPGAPMLTTDQVNKQLKTVLTIDPKSNLVSLGDFSHELALWNYSLG
jgi:transposase InsO family protein